MNFKFFLYIVSGLLLFSVAAEAAENSDFSPIRVGIVENQYDHVEKLLTKYKIPYTMIKYRDLEKESLYSQLDALMIPCGAEPPLTSSVNILSRGTHLEGVTLNDQYYKIDSIQTGKYIRRFIEKGGAVYVSDFSFSYLQSALTPFSFFKDFPYIGLAGSVRAECKNDLSHYQQGAINLEMSHSGWVTPSEIRGSESLLTGNVDTPLGMKNTPLAALISLEKGIALYTSYHSENDPCSLMRYYIFRTVYNRDLERMETYIRKWEQSPQTIVVDKSLPGETFRQYRLKVRIGGSYLYFKTDGGIWKVDIFDEKGSFLYSEDAVSGSFSYFVPSGNGKDIYLKLIPLDKEKFHVYTAATAYGFRLFPYYLRIIIGSFGMVLLVLYLRFLKRQRFKGRVRAYDQPKNEDQEQER